MTVRVEGLSALGESMRSLAADVNNKIAGQATGAAARQIRDRARQIAPVADEPHVQRGVEVPPGNMRDNIVAKKVPASHSKFTSEHYVLVRGGRQHGFASHVAALLEFGTVKMSPKPTMRPAFDSEKGRAVEIIKQKIAAGIEKARR